MIVETYRNVTERHEVSVLLSRANYYEIEQLMPRLEDSLTKPPDETVDITEMSTMEDETFAISEYDISLEEMVSAIRKINIPYAKSLQDRILFLSKLSAEEPFYQAPIVPDSLRDFISFLQLTPGIKRPSVVLTPEGNIQAEWHRSENQHLVIEFLGKEDVLYVIFAPDPKYPARTVRSTGRATLISVMALLKPYGLDSWVTENDRKDNK